ncbi:plasmid partitioning protein RepB [Pararhizobium haloflavum]|uniref:plasmid partitioning protein RepB n=1 Tax=Pararhizobium haloflavum TaxID=2037914 RepID=UPI000C174474|nr:plasmid partitioning protein RepB [Pararhizobium haloflavum]
MSSKRKDHLKAIFGGERAAPKSPLPAKESETSAPQRAPETKSAEPPRAASGAVKAMGLQLSSVSRELDAARALKESLSSGDRVVDVDPAIIDPSIVRDRLSQDEDGDETFADLVESMRENGQQVPVLLRPHPDKAGRYQVAYGHRRVSAARRLERPVRAVVRDLEDHELVMAQGKENTERRNLSFIERAFFAQTLIHRGFDRGVVQQALSLHKTEMTRFLQVAALVPPMVIRAIGPAPKAGRPRWLELAEIFQKRPAAMEIAIDEINAEAFKAASSDERFKRLHTRLGKRQLQRAKAERDAATQHFRRGDGQVVASVPPGKRKRIEFDETRLPGLADYVASALPDLIARYEARSQEESDDDAV